MTPIELAGVARTLLLAGKVMLSSGAGGARVEETVARIGLACNVDSVNVFSTLTGIFVSLSKDDAVITRLITVKRRTTDLTCIARVNELSRQFEKDEITYQELLDKLTDMSTQPPLHPLWLRLLARALATPAFALLLGGTWTDFLPALCAGMFSQLVYALLTDYAPNFVVVFLSTLTGTFVALMAVTLGFVSSAKYPIIGMLMWLVPGMAMTSSIRDMIAGDLISGVSRFAEASLCAAAIAGGVYTIFAWLPYR